MNLKLSDKLRAAAELLEESGWIQRGYATPNGFCAIGAIGAVEFGVRTPLSLFREDFPLGLVEKKLDRHLAFLASPAEFGEASPSAEVMEWNDFIAESAEEVQTLLLLFAEVLDAETADEKVRADVLDQLVALRVPAREPESVA